MIDWSVVKQAGDAAGRAYQRAVSEPYESAFDRHVKTQLEPLRRYLGSSDFLGKLEKLIHDTHGKLLVTRPDDRDALQKVRRAWEVVRGLRFGTKKPEALTHSELAALAPFLPDDVASPEMRQLLGVLAQREQHGPPAPAPAEKQKSKSAGDVFRIGNLEIPAGLIWFLLGRLLKGGFKFW
jgi:hypothetical protein